MELHQMKADVVNGYRNEQYLNELEIKRLVETEQISHRDRIKAIKDLVRENVILSGSINLMEQYFPAIPASSTEQSNPLTSQ